MGVLAVEPVEAEGGDEAVLGAGGEAVAAGRAGEGGEEEVAAAAAAALADAEAGGALLFAANATNPLPLPLRRFAVKELAAEAGAEAGAKPTEDT